MQPASLRQRLRSRSRGQSIVEFGLVAIIFGLMVSGIFDFGILLNGWLGVSSSSRDLARQLAVGVCPASATVRPCVSGGGGTPMAPAPLTLPIQGVDRTLGPNAVTVTVSVCSVDTTTCYSGNSLWNIYPNGSCDLINNPGACTSPIHPTTSDSIVVSVQAQIQVVTPLVRAALTCTNPRCDVPLSSRAVARFEGPFL